mmetsp:Transcript_37807/g.97779  ORF Transcript_37807/g.97779 Transcript_37807/m.97779 type:complete len:513 (+) Transcript_37807:138-1676(+)
MKGGYKGQQKMGPAVSWDDPNPYGSMMNKVEPWTGISVPIRPGGCSGGMPAAPRAGKGGPAGYGPIAQACEAAASGATSGETVQDTEITVVDPNEQPVPPTKFDSFDQCTTFPPQVLVQLKAAFPAPSQIQAYTWPLALQGRDVIGIAATGSGKTLAFLLPAFSDFFNNGWNCQQKGAGLLVMSPTRELAQQTEDEANKFGRCLNMRTVSMYGGCPKRDQMQKYRNGVHCIVACPGRLNDFLEGGQIHLDRVGKLVLDEADRMLDMGFEPQIRKILQHMGQQRHNMFFTATWPRDVRQLASTMLWQPFRVMIGKRDQLKANQDVTQQVRIVDQRGKQNAIKELLQEAGLMDPNSSGKALVFASTKRMCEELSQQLYREGIHCAAIHGDKEQRERDHALNGLKAGRIRVLCATDVAARGLDIKGVGLVVNYDVANNTEDYVHRIGRTGRAGEKGDAFTLLYENETTAAQQIAKVFRKTGQALPQELQDICSGGGGSLNGTWGGKYAGGGGGWN